MPCSVYGVRGPFPQHSNVKNEETPTRKKYDVRGPFLQHSNVKNEEPPTRKKNLSLLKKYRLRK